MLIREGMAVSAHDCGKIRLRVERERKVNISKKVGRIPGMFVVGTLLLSMVMVDVNAVPVAKLCVDIPCWVGWLDREIVANVNITDVEDLYSFEFKLAWTHTIGGDRYLDLIEVEITPPAVWGANYVINKNETMEDYNATHGRYWLNVSALAPAPSFNGSIILAKLTFKVIYLQMCPPMEVWCFQDLYDTKLKDPEGLLISHEVYDGSLVILCLCPCIPEVEVTPDHYEATTFGEEFTVNIFYALHFSAFDFGHWKAKLGYNTTLLDVVKVEEGPFIPAFRKPDKRYFTANIHEEEGYVNMTGGILGPCASPYGGGILAKVTFRVTYVTTIPTIATCVLGLYDTDFTKSGGQPIIPPEVYNGSYQAPSMAPPVGGIYVPVNKLSLLAPYIALTTLLAAAVIAVGYVMKSKCTR